MSKSNYAPSKEIITLNVPSKEIIALNVKNVIKAFPFFRHMGLSSIFQDNGQIYSVSEYSVLGNMEVHGVSLEQLLAVLQ